MQAEKLHTDEDDRSLYQGMPTTDIAYRENSIES